MKKVILHDRFFPNSLEKRRNKSSYLVQCKAHQDIYNNWTSGNYSHWLFNYPCEIKDKPINYGNIRVVDAPNLPYEGMPLAWSSQGELAAYLKSQYAIIIKDREIQLISVKEKFKKEILKVDWLNQDLCFARNDNKITGKEGVIELWNVVKEAKYFQYGLDEISSFDCDTASIAVSLKSVIKILDPRHCTTSVIINKKYGSSRLLKISSGYYISAYDGCDLVHIWDIRQTKHAISITQNNYTVTSMSWTEYRLGLLAVSEHNTIRFWNINNAKEITHLQFNDTVQSFEFISNADWIVAVTQDLLGNVNIILKRYPPTASDSSPYSISTNAELLHSRISSCGHNIAMACEREQIIVYQRI